MNRKDFLKKGLLGATVLASANSVIGHDVSEKSTQPLDEQVGFNHLPQPPVMRTFNSVLHKADTRGFADHGWLQARHSFSFAGYYNPERMHFGVLRVINDDVIAGGMGFGTHPHDNMEIITIPLEGALRHQDSLGNSAVIHSGDVQVMSAGTGIKHSEFNANKDGHVSLFQIWMFPKKRSVTPRYDQITLNVNDRHNKLQQILSPNQDDEGVWVHQDAWFYMSRLDKGKKLTYNLNKTGNGVYIMVINGDLSVGEQVLNRRDGYGIWNFDTFELSAITDAEVLIMEVPMQIG